jgi:hypothetical protein
MLGEDVAAIEVSAGFSLLSIDVPMLPIFPVLTGGVALERGLSERLDLGVRYTTWLGFDHRLGPELQLALLRDEAWTAGLRTHPWLRIAGTAQGSFSYGGDVSTQAVAFASRAEGDVALTAELGATVQWVLFERLDGVGFVDPVPWLATADVVLEAAWADPWARALAVRLELGIPRAPADPFAVLGVRPRLVLAGSFGVSR